MKNGNPSPCSAWCADAGLFSHSTDATSASPAKMPWESDPGLQICAVSHVPWNRIPDLSSSGEYGLDRRRIAPSRSASNRDCCMNKDLAAVSGCPGRAMPATSSKPTFRRRQSPKAGKPSHRVTTPRSLRRHLTRRTAAYRPWKANATNTRAVLRCQPIWLRLVADC
jgi:hypothetical protein